jgi:hypothetical protein
VQLRCCTNRNILYVKKEVHDKQSEHSEVLFYFCMVQSSVKACLKCQSVSDVTERRKIKVLEWPIVQQCYRPCGLTHRGAWAVARRGI